jgi:quinol monooxygenase YgiN
MAGSVRVVVKVTARADKIADTKKLLLWLAEQSRAERGCVGYHVLQGVAEPHIFALEEEWDSQAALEAHVSTPHVQQSYAQAGGLVAAAPDRVVYKTIG